MAGMKLDTSIKDTFQGEIDTYGNLFADGHPAKRHLAVQSFASGAQTVTLLILKRLIAEKPTSTAGVADCIQKVHEEIEKWHEQNPF